MDDLLESEIIYNIATSHCQIFKQYFHILYLSLIKLFILAPGETFISKMLKPVPFIVLMLAFIIINTVIRQNKRLRSYVSNIHSALTPGAGLRFGNLASSAGLGSIVSYSCAKPVTQEVTEGLVGIYAMQGRRGNMEDRFCVLQDVIVGPNKRMSFFGVYDGHGGQYVAEYLRLHLFKNTVEKIKQLRSDMQLMPNGVMDPKNNGTTESKDGTGLASATKEDIFVEGKLSQTRGLSEAAISLHQYSSLKCNKDTNVENITRNKSQSVKVTSEDKDGHDFVHKSTELAENSINQTNSALYTEEPLKKDDAYKTVNIRRKSLANINANVKDENEVLTKMDYNQQYVDMNKNINYTKLLTDQILHIDSQVVEYCKSNTDLSGSTAVVAVLDGELLVVGNVGDSRAVMADKRGRAIPLSFDHKPNQLKEHRRIKEAGGFITFTGVWRVAGILATSRALGDFPLKHPRPLVTAEPDILTFSLHDHKADFVILATDGLWDVLSNEDAVTFVRSHIHEPDFGAKSVALHAYALGSQDNITVAIINFSKMDRPSDSR